MAKLTSVICGPGGHTGDTAPPTCHVLALGSAVTTLVFTVTSLLFLSQISLFRFPMKTLGMTLTHSVDPESGPHLKTPNLIIPAKSLPESPEHPQVPGIGAGKSDGMGGPQ